MNVDDAYTNMPADVFVGVNTFVVSSCHGDTFVMLDDISFQSFMQFCPDMQYVDASIDPVDVAFVLIYISLLKYVVVATVNP